MLQRSLVRCGLFSALVEEIKKVPAYLSLKAQEGAKLYVDSATETAKFLKGENPSESPEMQEKRRKHKEMYQAILNQQAAKAAAERAKEQETRAQLTWQQRLQLGLQEAKEAVKSMTSTKAGVMALLQHCTASHAAEVAIEQGIDVKNVQMVFEKAAASNAVGYEEVVVGYIDAPAASREEVMVFAEKLHKACPVAKSMHVEWRQGRPDADTARRARDVQEEMDRAAQHVEWAAGQDGRFSSSSSASPSSSSTAEPAIPVGMPGSRRTYAAPSSSSSARSHYRSFDDDRGDSFHLPGVKARKERSGESDAAGATPAVSRSPGAAATTADTNDGKPPQ